MDKVLCVLLLIGMSYGVATLATELPFILLGVDVILYPAPEVASFVRRFEIFGGAALAFPILLFYLRVEKEGLLH